MPFELNDERSETAVKSDQQRRRMFRRRRIGVSSNNGVQFCFCQAKRLFDKNIFSRLEGGHHLTRMLVVSGQNRDRVDLRISEYLACVGGAIFETKLVRRRP